MNAADAAATVREVGPLVVRIEEADARALALAVDPGGDDGPRLSDEVVPLIFPIRWLALPEIRQALGELVDMSNSVLVHEAQGFDSVAPFRTGVDYKLAACLTLSADAPPRVSVTGAVRDAAGTLLGELHATLRILPTLPILHTG